MTKEADPPDVQYPSFSTSLQLSTTEILWASPHRRSREWVWGAAPHAPWARARVPVSHFQVHHHLLHFGSSLTFTSNLNNFVFRKSLGVDSLLLLVLNDFHVEGDTCH